MSSSQQLTGFPGMLRPFKEYLESANLPSGAEVVFFGLPGTCLPFVELLCYAVRTLPITPVFVPRLDISNAKILINIEGFGFQIGEQARISNPAILVMMGGLSMPVSGIAASDAARIVQEYSDASTIGICFMHMFEKTGWTSEISFDLLIDAQVSVDVIRLPLP
ncbi:MAG TPA: DUF2124 family protein [Methanospirillum sp.]|nr:DUF2124 family protein [Methanospirillum sp.]